MTVISLIAIIFASMPFCSGQNRPSTKANTRLASNQKQVSSTNPGTRRAQDGGSAIYYDKTYKFKTRTIRIVEQVDRNTPRPAGHLSAIVNGHKYSIGYLRFNGASSLATPVVDPTGAYIAYSSGSGCGYEGEGEAVLISSIYGKRKARIISTCIEAGPQEFFIYKGRQYLLVSGTSDAGEEDDAFWLYDIDAKKMMVHGAGDLTKTSKHGFSYAYYWEHKKRTFGAVTMKTLVNGERPLKLLALPHVQRARRAVRLPH